MKNKKAQEEIAGFVLIVAIVIIILVILLAFIIRRPQEILTQSRDIYQFLESTVQYTTECALSYEPAYSNLGELIQECHEGLSICTSGEKPCELAEKTLNEIIEASFLAEEQAKIKGYEFKSIYTDKDIAEEIISLSKGNCSAAIRGSELLIPALPGTISNTLKLCY